MDEEYSEQQRDRDTRAERDSGQKVEDSRRFQIYLKINDDDNQLVNNLKIREYLKFKYNDAFVVRYCQEKYLEENQYLYKLYRSLDDVDYTPIRIETMDRTEVNKENQGDNQMDTTAQCNNQINSIIQINNQMDTAFEIVNKKRAAVNQMDTTDEIVNKKRTDVNQMDTTDEIVNKKSTDVNQMDTTDEIVTLMETTNDETLNTKSIEDNNVDEDLPTSSNVIECKFQSSPIWDHVEKTKDKNILRCAYCKKQYKSCGNTSNMLYHLRKQHPLFFNVSRPNIKQKKRPIENDDTVSFKKNKTNMTSNSQGIQDAFSKIMSFQEGGSMSDKISATILFMICRDMLPLSIVEFEGFNALLKLLAPLYKAPSKKTITRHLEARYSIMVNKLIHTLENVPFYCITADNWTDCSNQTYIGLTIHYLIDYTKMKSGFLGCFALYDRHTADYLGKSIMEVFEQFKISIDKITAMVTDGEAAIKKACINIVGKDKHLVCIAHVVAHLLPDSLKNLQELTVIIEKVKNIVTLIRRSNPASKKLMELQIKDGMSEESFLKLKQDVPTRWTSKVDSLERYLQLEKYVYIAMAECEHPVDLLTREELKILKDVMPIMKSVTTVITEISGDKYSTASIIIPIIHCMEKKIENTDVIKEVGKKFKSKLQNEILDRFKNFEQSALLSVPTLLDPRFKRIHFRDPVAVSGAINRINKAIKNLEVEPPQHSKSLPSTCENFSNIWDYHEAILEASVNNQRTSIERNLELDQYLKLPPISRKDDVFTFWKNVENSFPALSKLAFEKLFIIATSVPSERLFSKAGNTKRDRRNRLTAADVNDDRKSN